MCVMDKLSNQEPTHELECYFVYKDNLDSGKWEMPILKFIEVILLFVMFPSLLFQEGRFRLVCDHYSRFHDPFRYARHHFCDL